MQYIKVLMSFLGVLLMFGLSCAQKKTDQTDSSPPAILQETARSGKSAKIIMEARFKKSNRGVDASLKISGLQPNSQHGLHIHEVGVCDAPSFETAAGHFDPKMQQHGSPDSSASHLGHLGNITTDSNGKFAGTLTIKEATTDGANGILQRSLILHEKNDDLHTQPAGNSGPRIACVVIKSIEP